MRKLIELFKGKSQTELDADTNAALREIAGWPIQAHGRDGFRARNRHITIQRYATGRIINSIESIDEHEYEGYSDTWGK